MGELEIDLLSSGDGDETPSLARLLKQVSRSAPELTPERLDKVLRTPSTSILVATRNKEIVAWPETNCYRRKFAVSEEEQCFGAKIYSG